MTNTELQELISKSLEVRKMILNMIVDAHASHIGSSYSAVDLLVYLYEKVLKIDPNNPTDPNRDRFILSKGWGVSALYSILALKGFFEKDLLKTYCKDGSRFIGISTRNGIPGIEATTGSMGHGLPIGIGMALANRIQKKRSRVFVMLSDGECDEGSTWESILQAGHYKLDNLTVIVDYNKWQSFGRVAEILDLEPFCDKWNSFKWSCKEVNGHDFIDINKAFNNLPFEKGKPSVINAHTVKGKGVTAFENKNEWHYKTPTQKEIETAKKELNK